jgi:hypothetical protein
MILWGNIREFPLFSVLQFLAGQRQTGILEIQDFEEHGCIYLADGHIDAITMPLSDEAFGTRLVAAGFVSAKQVKQCLIDCVEDDAEHPVMAALLALVKTDKDELVKAVDRHAADQVMQLMYWNTGTFRLTVPAKRVVFPVVPSLDVENLLLEAYRRVDEGERPRREKVMVEEELCLTCTLECPPRIKERYLKSDVCLWRNMPSVLKDPLFAKAKRAAQQVVDEADDEGLGFL